MDLTATPTMRQVDPGSAALFDIDVRNVGQAQDVVTLEMTALPQNWTVLFSDTTVDLAPGGKETVTVTLRTPKGVLVTTEDLTVTGTSAMDSSWDSVDIQVKVRQVFGVDVSTSAVPTVAAGGDTSYTVMVANGGNGQDTVTLSIIPLGDSGTWAQISTVKLDIGPGMNKVHVQKVAVPSDTEAGAYNFLVRARSSGAGVDDSAQVTVEVKAAPSSDLVLEPWMFVALFVLIALVMAFLAARYTPAKQKGGTGASPSSDHAGPVRKVKKVKRKRSGRPDDEHHMRLERIEHRIEQLHQHVQGLHTHHEEVMAHLRSHMEEHHGLRDDDGKLPPIEDGGTAEEGAKVEQGEVPNERKDMEPSPPNEVLPAEGPPESMSVGDKYGEIRPPRSCPRCNEGVEEDWVRCASCGYLLPSPSQNR